MKTLLRGRLLSFNRVFIRLGAKVLREPFVGPEPSSPADRRIPIPQGPPKLAICRRLGLGVKSPFAHERLKTSLRGRLLSFNPRFAGVVSEARRGDKNTLTGISTH